MVSDIMPQVSHSPWLHVLQTCHGKEALIKLMTQSVIMPPDLQMTQQSIDTQNHDSGLSRLCSCVQPAYHTRGCLCSQRGKLQTLRG